MASKEIVGAAIQGSIRLTLPVSVAYDLDRFQQALANVAAQLGSTSNSSGMQAAFVAAREFVVDPASLQVKEAIPEP